MASSVYPEMTREMTKAEKDYHRFDDLTIYSLMQEYVGADCWGFAIQRTDGTLEPKFNTYALYDEAGKKDEDYRELEQYQVEDDYRGWMLQLGEEELEQWLKVGDSLLVYMFGEDTWRVTATKMSDGEYKFYGHAEK